MRRALFGLVLTLLAAGCTAPQAEAVDGGGDSPRLLGARGMASQLAARPREPMIEETTPAGFTLLPPPPELPRARPTVLRTSRPLQCVPYARQLSGINLRGDAWTWWKKAEGNYAKGHTPVPGAVLVLSKTRRLRLGHLAVVVEVRNSREIVVHQANWLNGGRIHRYTPVRDVSENNDWSVVRVWYTPGRVYGSRDYPAYGFIYPNPEGGPDLRQAAN
jgi:CHAP domain